MEKFIKLLNEYTKQSYDDYSFFKYIEYTHSFYVSDDGYESYMPEEVILGKKFGFISRLVENDKINYLQLIEDNTWNILKENWWDDKAALLMLLAIQDEPIKYLCEIIK